MLPVDTSSNLKNSAQLVLGHIIRVGLKAIDKMYKHYYRKMLKYIQLDIDKSFS